MMDHDDKANYDALREWLELRCSTCSYSLRGLGGDPIRCPECGNLTGRRAALAQALDTRVRERDSLRARLDTGPNLCAMAIGTAAFMSFWFAVLRTFFETIRLPVLITCAVIWLFGFALFSSQCVKLHGWAGAFLRYQAYGTFAALGNAAIVLAACVVTFAMLAAVEGDPSLTIFVLGGTIVYIWKVRPLRWFSRRATAELEPLVAQLNPDDTLDDADDTGA